MRHKNAGGKLSRNPSHRKALLRNLAKALLVHGRITTTEAKAKALRGVVEPLITLALKDDLSARRAAYRFLGEHKLVSRLFDVVGPLFAGGGGGYTRVVRLALPRKGDAAPMAIIELTRQAEKSSAEEPETRGKAKSRAASAKNESGEETPKPAKSRAKKAETAE